jgi:subtilase family serine protease
VVKDRSDVLLIGSRAVPALAPGTASSAATSVTVPKIASGNYYLLACADDLNVVAESDERNNCVASATVVIVR